MIYGYCQKVVNVIYRNVEFAIEISIKFNFKNKVSYKNLMKFIKKLKKTS